MDNDFFRNLYMAELACKKSIRKAIEARAKEGKCLIDGCECKSSKRGLCERHYQQFVGRRRKQNGKTEAAAFEAECIREGLILPPGAQRELQSNDPFKTARAS